MNEFATELNNVISPDYMKKMGLTKAPFSDLHDAGNYYENDNKINIQKKIAHLLEYTNLILFIQGAKGAGKTAIIKQRILQTKDDWNICYLSAKDYTTASALIEKLATDLQLHITSNEVQAFPIQEQLDILCKTGKLPILIIDDIERLKEALIPALSSLIQIQENGRPSLRLIVSGEDIPMEFLDAIPKNTSQDNGKDSNEENLKYLPVLPFTETETGEYLKFRLAAAGYDKASPFNTETVNKIYLEAKGFPSAINQLANNWLSEFSKGKIKKAAFFNLDSINFNLSANNNTLKLAAASLAAMVVIIISINFSSDPDIQQEDKILAIPAAGIVEPAITAADAIESENVKSLIENEKIALDSPPLISKEIISSPTDNTNASTSTREGTLTDNSVIEKTEDKESELQSEPPITIASRPIQTAPQIIDRATTSTEQISIQKETQKTFRTTASTVNWVNSQNPSFFTLQLIGGTHKSSTENFIKKHGIKSDAHIISTTRNGNPWYSVIYKSYRQRNKAQAAADSLPDALKRTKPWIRTFGHIKRDMK